MKEKKTRNNSLSPTFSNPPLTTKMQIPHQLLPIDFQRRHILTRQTLFSLNNTITSPSTDREESLLWFHSPVREETRLLESASAAAAATSWW